MLSVGKGEGDIRAMVDILKYLTDRRDGRPAQSINLTQQPGGIAREELARARAVAAEVREGHRRPLSTIR